MEAIIIYTGRSSKLVSLKLNTKRLQKKKERKSTIKDRQSREAISTFQYQFFEKKFLYV